jgi:hypothetical protein
MHTCKKHTMILRNYSVGVGIGNMKIVTIFVYIFMKQNCVLGNAFLLFVGQE